MQKQNETTLFSEVTPPTDGHIIMARLPYKILTAGLSDIGLVRQNNEDVWAQQPSIGFFVLADGMGGHQAGEVAAREATASLCRILKRKITSSKNYSLKDFQELLKRAIIYVNGLVYKMGRSKFELRGMGTTLCCLLFHEEGIVLAHVGDSRIYRMRNGSFEQLTKDHSLLRNLVEQGQLSDQQATGFLYKNIITKAIGTEAKVEPSIVTDSIQEGDIYLMCSDGLSDLLSAKEIANILLVSSTKEAAVKALVDRANDEGGRDNITVVFAKIQGLNEQKNLPG